MKKEHVDYLTTVYPEIFKGKYGGIAVNDGWFDIINQLCININSHMKWKKDIEPIELEQVKEKFGGLRFYFQGGDEYIRGLVSMAESMSGVTCEECGAPGETGGRGWISTLCPTHRAERDAERAKREAEWEEQERVRIMKAEGHEE